MSSNNTIPKQENPVMQHTQPGFRHSRVVPILQYDKDGNQLKLPMVVLTGREMSEVESKAYTDTLKLFNGKCPKSDEPSNWDQQLEAQRSYWTIFLSLRNPEDITKKWFISKEQVEDTYNWDEAGILMSHFLTVRLTQPHLVNLDPNDPNAYQTIIDTIKKAGTESDFFMNGLTTHASNQLIKFLVAKLEPSQNING